MAGEGVEGGEGRGLEGEGSLNKKYLDLFFLLIIIYNANVCKTFTYSLVPGTLMY